MDYSQLIVNRLELNDFSKEEIKIFFKYLRFQQRKSYYKDYPFEYYCYIIYNTDLKYMLDLKTHLQEIEKHLYDEPLNGYSL